MVFSQRTYDRVLLNKIEEHFAEKSGLMEKLLNKDQKEDKPDSDEDGGQEKDKPDEGSEDEYKDEGGSPDEDEDESPDKDDHENDKDKKSKDMVTSGQSVEVLQGRLDLIKAFIS